MIEELAGGQCVGPVIDVVAQPFSRRELVLTPQRIKQVCGIEISPGRKDHAKLREFLGICKSK